MQEQIIEPVGEGSLDTIVKIWLLINREGVKERPDNKCMPFVSGSCSLTFSPGVFPTDPGGRDWAEAV